MSGILGATIGSYSSGSLTLEFLDELDYSTSNTSTSSLTITHPVTVQAGDLMILFEGTWDNDSDYINAVPTNFTEIYKNAYLYVTSTYMAIAISARILPNTNDITTPTPVGTTVDGHHYNALYFRPSKSITSITPSGTINNQNTTSNPTSQTVSASGGTVPLIVFGLIQTTSSLAAFSTENPAFDNEYTSSGVTTSGSAYARVGYKLYNSSPQDHSIDMNDLGTQRLTSFYLEVA